MLINNTIVPRTTKGFDGRSKGQEVAAEADAGVAEGVGKLGDATQGIFNYAEATHNPGQSLNNPEEQVTAEEAPSADVVGPPPAPVQEQPRVATAAHFFGENTVETIV